MDRVSETQLQVGENSEVHGLQDDASILWPGAGVNLLLKHTTFN